MAHESHSRPAQTVVTSRDGKARTFGFVKVVLLVLILLAGGCAHFNPRKIINPGRWLGLEKTAPDEKYYLVKDVSLSSGAPGTIADAFDHNMNPMIFLYFTPKNEKNHYVAETRWYDPTGEEFRKIRTTHDIQQEGKKSIDRRNIMDGTPRVQSISTAELYNHKPGLWKVALYLDGELARRFEFTVR